LIELLSADSSEFSRRLFADSALELLKRFKPAWPELCDTATALLENPARAASGLFVWRLLVPVTQEAILADCFAGLMDTVARSLKCDDHETRVQSV
jgi:hypothetical protein